MTKRIMLEVEMLDLSRWFLEGWAARSLEEWDLGEVFFAILREEAKYTQVGHFSQMVIKTAVGGWLTT